MSDEANDPTADELKVQLAIEIEKAINHALDTYASPQGIGDIEVYGFALTAAENIVEKYGDNTKDKTYALCKWNPHYAEPSRGSYIGAWVPV